MTLDRRNFVAVSAAALVYPANPVQANIIGLAPGRFFAGLIFDVARAVVVKLATDYVVAQLRSGAPRAAFAGMGITGALAASDFSAEHYQAAIVLEGLAEYRTNEGKRIEAYLAASDEATLARLDAVRKTLCDRKAEAAFASPAPEASRLVRATEPLHNILSIHYLAGTDEKTERLYRQMIDQIGSTVFPAV